MSTAIVADRHQKARRIQYAARGLFITGRGANQRRLKRGRRLSKPATGQRPQRTLSWRARSLSSFLSLPVSSIYIGFVEPTSSLRGSKSTNPAKRSYSSIGWISVRAATTAASVCTPTAQKSLTRLYLWSAGSFTPAWPDIIPYEPLVEARVSPSIEAPTGSKCMYSSKPTAAAR